MNTGSSSFYYKGNINVGNQLYVNLSYSIKYALSIMDTHEARHSIIYYTTRNLKYLLNI